MLDTYDFNFTDDEIRVVSNNALIGELRQVISESQERLRYAALENLHYMVTKAFPEAKTLIVVDDPAKGSQDSAVPSRVLDKDDNVLATAETEPRWFKDNVRSYVSLLGLHPGASKTFELGSLAHGWSAYGLTVCSLRK